MQEVPFGSKLEELGVQLQMFSHAPTKQAWDIIQQLYRSAEVQLDGDFERNREKIQMFFSAVLSRHAEWALGTEEQALAAQWTPRRAWLLSASGDSQRKLDHLWYAYFATGDTAFPLKVAEISNNLSYPNGLREVAVRTYHLIASTSYPELETLAPEVYKIGAYLEEQRLRKR